MKIFPKIHSILLIISCGSLLFSQDKKAGPIISEYGKVWSIENPDYPTITQNEFKAVFDVMSSPDSHQQINPALETVARYLNMHAQAGVPADKIHAVAVVHNKASKDMMTDVAYTRRYGFPNPNLKLVQALTDSGVEVIFCGQSSKSRDIPKSDLIPGVKISLSAMTALIQWQEDGYNLIKF